MFENCLRLSIFTKRGWGCLEWSPRRVGTFFTLNGTWLGLRASIGGGCPGFGEGIGFEAFTLAHNVESEKEVNKVVDQAVAAGAAVKKPQKAFRGGYSGYFKDLDGHLWEIAHNPLFWVGLVKTHNKVFKPFAALTRTLLRMASSLLRNGAPRCFTTWRYMPLKVYG